MTITPLLPSDIPAALRLSTQATWNQVEADWQRVLSLWPEGCFAGRVNDQVIATTILASHTPHLAWIGVVLVDQAHRGKGYGGQMLDAVMSYAQDIGLRTLSLDATEFGRPIYLARGFADLATLGRWVRPPTAGGATGQPIRERAINPSAVEIDTPVWKELLAFDLRATRLDRARLLNHLKTEPAVHCHTLGQAGALQAFAFHRPGRTAAHIGPVIAETESAAEQLLDRMLAENAAGANHAIQLDIPAGRLANWLKTRDFSLLRTVVRMRAGIRGPDLLGPRIFAAFGFDLG